MFFETIHQFKKYYGLDMYSLKELDRYLWLLGKKWFPRKDKGCTVGYYSQNITLQVKNFVRTEHCVRENMFYNISMK